MDPSQDGPKISRWHFPPSPKFTLGNFRGIWKSFTWWYGDYGTDWMIFFSRSSSSGASAIWNHPSPMARDLARVSFYGFPPLLCHWIIKTSQFERRGRQQWRCDALLVRKLTLSDGGGSIGSSVSKWDYWGTITIA